MYQISFKHEVSDGYRRQPWREVLILWLSVCNYGQLFDTILNCLHLSGDHREHFNRYAVELVEAAPLLFENKTSNSNYMQVGLTVPVWANPLKMSAMVW